MVTQEQLEALDLLLWLGSGPLAASRLGCNQSSVSRRIQGCLEVLALRLRRVGGRHILRGRIDYLALERHLHQRVRLDREQNLRLEATHCSSHLLHQPPLQGWILGSFDHHGVNRMHDLLRERIVDAWLSSDSFDLPPHDDPDLTTIPLSRWPALLLASSTHPLARETGIKFSDLDRFPVLELPEAIYPRMARAVTQLGFRSTQLRLSRYDRGSWNQQTADQVTLAIGSCVSALGAGQVRINWDPGLQSGETLVLRRDLAAHAAVASLLRQLQPRLAALRPRCSDLTLLI